MDTAALSWQAQLLEVASSSFTHFRIIILASAKTSNFYVIVLHQFLGAKSVMVERSTIALKLAIELPSGSL
jgi:hypothetical protein